VPPGGLSSNDNFGFYIPGVEAKELTSQEVKALVESVYKELPLPTDDPCLAIR
jgi:hypothetical protein